MTTDQNDPDGLNWQIAKAVQPEIYKMLNHVSKLDHNHVRDMNVDRNRGTGTWWRAVKVADAAISVLPDEHDCGPHVVKTVDELEALPIATVVRSAGGTIGSRLSATEGVCFGIEASFPWRNLSLPATVLYPHACPDDEPEHGNPFGSPRYWLGWTSKYTRDGHVE